MEIDFWLERWQNEQIGFHQQTVNPYLAYFYGEKGPSPEQRKNLKVFVPLCGKSKDMLWLSQNGYQVFGVECSERAVKDFFEENALNYKHATKDEHSLYLSSEESLSNADNISSADNLSSAENISSSESSDNLSGIEIYQGDFFALQPDIFTEVSDVFDRASLVALPGEMRQQYAEKMAELLSPGTRTLLVTLTYDQSEMEGPPFSVSEKDVEQLYSENFSIEKLCFKDVISNEPKMQERGLTSLLETVYKLVRK